MTSEQIRTEAIERVARGLHAVAVQMRDAEDEMMAPYNRFPYRERAAPEPLLPFDETKDLWLTAATPIVDELGDMLPTAVQFGVRHPVHQDQARFVGEPVEDCERYAEEFETTVIRQYLGEWVPHE